MKSKSSIGDKNASAIKNQISTLSEEFDKSMNLAQPPSKEENISNKQDELM